MDRSRCSSTPGVAATCASKTSTFATCPCGSSVRPGRRSPMDRRKRLSYHESVLMRCIFLPAVFSLLAAAQQIPRPEFPQPQFQREHWLNLNGPWEFEFDDDNRGLAEDWAGASKSFSRHITVRAEDPPTDRYIPRGKQYWEPKSASIFYTRTSGIWQTVWLEAAGDSYLTRVNITPSLDGAVRFDASIARPAPGVEFVAKVS